MFRISNELTHANTDDSVTLKYLHLLILRDKKVYKPRWIIQPLALIPRVFSVPAITKYSWKCVEIKIALLVVILNNKIKISQI